MQPERLTAAPVLVPVFVLVLVSVFVFVLAVVFVAVFICVFFFVSLRFDSLHFASFVPFPFRSVPIRFDPFRSVPIHKLFDMFDRFDNGLGSPFPQIPQYETCPSAHTLTAPPEPIRSIRSSFRFAR